MRCKILTCLLPALLFTTPGSAGDWPQFLGPTRNGIYDGNDVTDTWPSSGPRTVWKQAVGHGFSGPVVSGHLLILFHRANDEEKVSCLDPRTGKEVWTFEYPTSYQDDFGFDDGPRSTPAIAEQRLYTLGAQGMLHCLDLATGKKIWAVDLQKEYQAGKGFFGIACSPLVQGDSILLSIGGTKGAGIVAINKTDGTLRWKTSEDEAGYSSPMAATIDGQKDVLFLTREGLIGLDPDAGSVRFQYPWHSRNRMSVNAATPLVIGDTIFLSACYGTGAVLLRSQENKLEKIWSSDDLLSNHYATSIALNGFLYGVHGRTDPGFSPHPKLRCLDLKAQKVRWETDSIGAATLTLAGNQLLILTEKGEFVAADATPDGFKPKTRAQVLSSEVRAFPALAQGYFYARSKNQLICLDLRKTTEK